MSESMRSWMKVYFDQVGFNVKHEIYIAAGDDHDRIKSKVDLIYNDLSELDRLRALNAELLEVLEEIVKCEAPFKVDRLEFANSVISKMVEIAQAAIAKAKGAQE